MSLTILVPLDGSPLAERALPYALSLARRSDSRISLVRATEAHTPSGADTLADRAGARLRAEAELTLVAARVRANEIPVDTCVYDAAAPDAILHAAEAEQAGLVVMSTHGRSGVGRWIYGSVAEAVLRHARVPVLLVPSTCERAWAANTPLRVLVPLDGSELAETAVEHASALVAPGAATLILLQVVEPILAFTADGLSATSPFDAEEALAGARTYLETLAERAAALGWTTEVDAVLGYAAGAIAAAARDHQVDVVAMATHGRGGIARVVLGSVATGVLQRSHTPVLVVPPGAVSRVATAPVSAAAAEPSITLTLSPREVRWVQRGLEALVRSAEREVGGRYDESESAMAIEALAHRVRRAAAPPKSLLLV
jgi:nucleotide-binding universal stress UspA family protein